MGAVVHGDQLGDIDAVQSKAATGIFRFKTEEGGRTVADFNDNGRTEGSHLIQGKPEDHEGEAPVVGGGGVDGEAGFDGPASDLNVLVEQVGVGSEGHRTESVGGKRGKAHSVKVGQKNGPGKENSITLGKKVDGLGKSGAKWVKVGEIPPKSHDYPSESNVCRIFPA